MKRPWENRDALLLLFSASISASYATQWEFGMKVQQNGQNVALPVYLYRYGDLSFPYRLGTSNSGGANDNFMCDIDEGPLWPEFHDPLEPNTDNPTFSVITPGLVLYRMEHLRNW